jgi:YHS domain-containing protein
MEACSVEEEPMKYLALALLTTLGLAACQSNGTEGSPNPTTHVWTTDQGTFAVDAVSGETVDVSKAVSRQYLGETYYFKNEETAKEFAANPDRYIYDRNQPERSSSPGTQSVR